MRHSRRNAGLIIAVWIIGIPIAASAQQPSLNSPREELAANLPDNGEIYLGMFTNGIRDGHMRLGWRKSGDGILVYDRSLLPSAEIFEAMSIYLTNDLGLKTASVDFHQGTLLLDIDLKVEEMQISGTRTVWKPEGATTTSFLANAEADTIVRPLAFIMPLVLNREAGDAIRFRWYGILQNQLADIVVTVADGGTIETPAGVFDTLRYELRGGSPDNDIYVLKGENRRIVRIDVVGSPITFLALPEPASSSR